jgi:putative membrane protein
MRNRNRAWATLFATLSLSLAAVADPVDTGNAKAGETDRLTDTELDVLAHIHQVNQMEIHGGRLARTNSTTPAIKTYGDMLVTDHSKNDREIQAIARKHHQTIPSEQKTMSPADRQQMIDNTVAMEALAKLHGSDFDRQYLQMMVKGHEAEIEKLASESDESPSPDIKALLEDMRPVLQKHLDEARALERNNAQAAR